VRVKTYEDYSQSPDGWNVSATLEVTDDGRFSYSEGWTDYTSASLSGGAGGTWRRGAGVIFFRAERVYPPIYFPWEMGRELMAIVRGDALEFAHGWTLRSPPDHVKEIPVRNDANKPMPLVLEPWGIRRTLEPGERVRIVTQGDFGVGQFEKVEYGADEIVYRGWGGTWATVIPEPSPPAPTAPTPQPSAEAAKPAVKPAVKPSVKPPVKPPAPSPPGARFEPRAPSPELAALLRRWVDEQGDGNMIARLCKENDAIPLDCTEIYLWVLQTDGQVLCIDHESFAQRAEPETDREVAYGKIAAGAERHPELLELLPPDRGGTRQL
jgi:hypothetical protein